MTDAFTLSSDLTERILTDLGCPRKPPSIRYLNRLIRAYIRRVPWESVSRIVKRHSTGDPARCPRWPEEFWTEALRLGTGGTCFENNLAFFTLLSALGFRGYLTINDMLPARACHTAIIIHLHRQKYLVDVAIPMHCALPVQRGKPTRRSTSFHDYTVRPCEDGIFEIERSHHPKRNIYTLIDKPVPLKEYRAALTRDYEGDGYFLDRVIIVKVIADALWRFSSAEKPYKLEAFMKRSKQQKLLAPEKVSQLVAERFDIAEELVAAALSYVA
jgi:arylamine N-acetyltransferase